MRNFFMTFFSVKGLEQKIDRFVDYFHCPLEDEVDNWWEKKLYILKRVQLYIHTLLFIQSQIHPFRTQTISLFSIMIFSVISFEFSNREVENYCNVHITKFQKKFWFRTNSNTQHLLLVLKEINNVVCYAKLPYPCPPPRY